MPELNQRASDGLRRTVIRTAVLISIVAAILTPVIYYATAYSYEKRRLNRQVELIADRVSERIYLNPELWRFESERISKLINELGEKIPDIRVEIRDSAGDLVTEVGNLQNSPVYQTSALLNDGGGITGEARLFASLMPIISRTALVSLMSIIVSVGFFVSLMVLPVRAIDRALTRLRDSQTELKRLNADLEHRVEERTQELKSAQETMVRQERLSVLGQLTGTVAHELRNPLGTIRTSIFAIDRKIRDKNLGTEKAVDRITRNIDRCNRIISELLDFTRTSTAQLESVALDEWLELALDEMEVPEGIEVSRHLDSDAHVLIDPERFRRVIINLYDNACHALQEKPAVDGKLGDIWLRCSVSGPRVIVLLEDTGPGMDDELLSHVFEPLYSTKGFGVGLGLPIVKQIIEQHHGEISIASVVGQGTQVRINLPVAVSEKG